MRQIFLAILMLSSTSSAWASPYISFEEAPSRAHVTFKPSWSLPSHLNFNSADFKAATNKSYLMYSQEPDQQRALLAKVILLPPDSNQNCGIYLLSNQQDVKLAEISLALSLEGAWLSYNAFGIVANAFKATEFYLDESLIRKSEFRAMGWTTQTTAKLLGQRDFKVVELTLPLQKKTPGELLVQTLKNRMGSLQAKL